MNNDFNELTKQYIKDWNLCSDQNDSRKSELHNNEIMSIKDKMQLINLLRELYKGRETQEDIMARTIEIIGCVKAQHLLSHKLLNCELL